MANHKSAIKEHRQSLGRRDRNRFHRARLRTLVKKYRTAIEAGELDVAREMLPSTLSLVDRVAKLGGIATNAADRTKSRLTRALNAASA
jgi:small subunit ribosomal protein S20